MGTPLDGPELLAYVRARMHELDDAEERVGGLTIDWGSTAFLSGYITGRASAYHDVEHLLEGWYGGVWAVEPEDDSEEQRRSHT